MQVHRLILGLVVLGLLLVVGCTPSAHYLCNPKGPTPSMATPTATYVYHPPCPNVTSTPIVTRCVAVTGIQSEFNAFDDFSFISNPVPDGVWKYGSTDTLGGSFTLYAYQSTDYQKDDPLRNLSLWQGDPNQYDPNVMKNESGVDMTSNEGSWVFHPSSVYLHFHPGPEGQYSLVRWVCPEDGSYRVDAAFCSLRNGGPQTTTDVHVLANNAVLYSHVINGHFSDGESPYAAVLALKACDTLDFAVGLGDNGNYYYDSSGLRVTINRE